VLSITMRFRIRPEWADRWMEMVEEFTAATRAERANLWFIWTQHRRRGRHACSGAGRIGQEDNIVVDSI